jgi:3-hydroxymyristoyl/3-hydroxydecanoyl-(acyl carrier protein) dehydratase
MQIVRYALLARRRFLIMSSTRFANDRRFAAPITAVDHVSISEEGDALTLHAATPIDGADPYVRAHFPQCAIYPGLFVVEGLRQAAARILPDGHD